MIKFTILVYTYNRLPLLKDTIASVLNQKHRHLELVIVNNGSTDGTQQYIETIRDPRVKIIRCENNTGVVSDIPMEEITGDYVLPFLGDDDILTNQTLEIAARILSDDPGIDCLLLGCVPFNLDTLLFDAAALNVFDGELKVLDGKREFHRFVNSWGIGKKIPHESFGRVHSSASLFSRALLQKTKLAQKDILVQPFGDVGLIGAFIHADKVRYLCAPLVIIGVHENREMSMARYSNRRLCDKLSGTLLYSPVKAATFFSLGAESHLRVIHANHLENSHDWSYRPKFYLIHITYLLCDKRWDGRTVKDLMEALPLALKSILHHFPGFGLRSPLSFVRRLLFHMAKPGTKGKHAVKFSSAFQLADWILARSESNIPPDRKEA